MASTLQLRLPVPAEREVVQRLCAGLRRQLGAGTVTAVVCRVDGPAGDLATVDAVARLALVARRAGVAFALDPPGRELAALLALTGLEAVLVGRPDDA